MIDPSARIHPSVDIEPDVSIGPGTSVWHRAQIRTGAREAVRGFLAARRERDRARESRRATTEDA